MSDKDLSGCFGVLSLAAIAIVIGVIVNGWALATLWGWFVVPVFGLPVLTIGQAVGISCVTSFLFPKQTNQDDGKKKETWENIFNLLSVTVLQPLFAVFVVWIVLQFV